MTAPKGSSVFLKDAVASIVVFLVALPLCMGIAIASGVPPALGLVTGIIGGLVVGSIAGSPLQVSGPAAGLTIIIYALVQKHGLEMLGPVVLLGGVIQIVAGALRTGRWFRAVPPSLIHGMLGGIGVLILASQFHVMLARKPGGSGIGNLATIPKALFDVLVGSAGDAARMAAMIGGVTIAVLLLWGRLAHTRLKIVPAPLVAVIVGSVVANLVAPGIKFVSVPDSLIGAGHWVSLASFKRLLLDPSLIGSAFALAVIASAETLLCASAVDRMHTGPRTKYDRELAAQGVGNALCGLLGALPMTGVIVRSSANVQAGATTRISAILHGAWLLLLVLLAPQVLAMIPIASLAAILVFTGVKLVNVKILKALKSYGTGEVLTYVVTLVGIVSTDLLKGVGLGLLFALARLIVEFTRLEVSVLDDATSNQTHLHLRGRATFLRLPKLTEALEALPANRSVHVDARALEYMDHASLEALMEWERQHRVRGGSAAVPWDALPVSGKGKGVPASHQPARAHATAPREQASA